MNRRKKLIILILIVCIIGIFAFVGSFFLGGPSLASGDKNILVLASDKDEQPGGGVDMAYMVKLENGTIANYTPVYPGGILKGQCVFMTVCGMARNRVWNMQRKL